MKVDQAVLKSIPSFLPLLLTTKNLLTQNSQTFCNSKSLTKILHLKEEIRDWDWWIVWKKYFYFLLHKEVKLYFSCICEREDFIMVDVEEGVKKQIWNFPYLSGFWEIQVLQNYMENSLFLFWEPPTLLKKDVSS